MAAGSVVVVFCPLPSACFLQSSGAMSAALIMSAADTADPDVQQQRAAGERRARGGRGDGRGRAVGRGERCGSEHSSIQNHRWRCKNHRHRCVQDDQGKKKELDFNGDLPFIRHFSDCKQQRVTVIVSK